MVKITQAKLEDWERLVGQLGERKAAIALDGSQSGFRNALLRSFAPKDVPDRRGAPRALSPAMQKRIAQFREKEVQDGHAVQAKFVMRKLRIRDASVRTVQRELSKEDPRDGERAEYVNRPSGKRLTDADKVARVVHCSERIAVNFVYKGPKRARGGKTRH